MYAVVMFLKTLWNSHGGFYFRSRFLCFKQPIKKIRINSKTLCPQSPSFLVPRPQSAKRSEKGYGDENALTSNIKQGSLGTADIEHAEIHSRLQGHSSLLAGGAFARKAGGSGNTWLDWRDLNKGSYNLADEINLFRNPFVRRDLKQLICLASPVKV